MVRLWNELAFGVPFDSSVCRQELGYRRKFRRLIAEKNGDTSGDWDHMGDQAKINP